MLGSPYIVVLDKLGIPAAADIMNAVILTALLSSLNSGLYATSRMLFALTRRGDAPNALVKTNRRGVPARAILLGTIVALISIAFAYTSPDTVFAFLISSYGATALFVYLLVAIAQVKLRRKLERDDPNSLTLKMWLFPGLSYLTIAAMAAVIVAMGVSPATRTECLLSLVIFGITLAAYRIRLLAEKRHTIRHEGGDPPRTRYRYDGTRTANGRPRRDLRSPERTVTGRPTADLAVSGKPLNRPVSVRP